MSTGIESLDELLAAVASEGGMKLNVDATGDLWIDDHHTTEDVAITVVGAVLVQVEELGLNHEHT